MSSIQDRALELAVGWSDEEDPHLEHNTHTLATLIVSLVAAEIDAERGRCIAHLEQTAKEIDDGDLLPLSSQVELSNAAARIRYLGDHGWPDDPPRVGRPGKSARQKRVAP